MEPGRCDTESIQPRLYKLHPSFNRFGFNDAVFQDHGFALASEPKAKLRQQETPRDLRGVARCCALVAQAFGSLPESEFACFVSFAFSSAAFFSAAACSSAVA